MITDTLPSLHGLHEIFTIFSMILTYNTAIGLKNSLISINADANIKYINITND